jgi:Trypsin
VAQISRNAKLDDGTLVRASGDAAILLLAPPLPELMEAAPVGEGGGKIFTIAGYGTTNERWRGAGPLNKADLVMAGEHDLVDPNRRGSISASGCYGDSGGPVMRGGMLVGVISRASHPSPRIACGDLTRWAPISITTEAEIATANEAPLLQKTAPRARHRQTTAKPVQQSWLAWFASNNGRAELNKSARR